MKLAGSNRKGHKLDSVAYDTFARPKLSVSESIAANHGALAVFHKEPQDFDDYDVFAPTRGIDSHLSAENQKILDAMIESAGVKNILHALGLLLESRVDDNFLQNGMLIHHLARENAFARAAERLHGLALHPDISGLPT